MERVDLFVKYSIAAWGTFISYLVNGFGLAFAILLGMMVLDYVTGLMVAVANKSLSSSVGTKGFIKKAYVIILIGAIYMLAHAVDGFSYIGDGVTVAYIVIEFISITENGGKLGVPMPAQVKKVIAVLKDGGKDDKAI